MTVSSTAQISQNDQDHRTFESSLQQPIKECSYYTQLSVAKHFCDTQLQINFELSLFLCSKSFARSACCQSVFSAKMDLMEQRLTKQLATIGDELASVKQQLVQLVQSYRSANSAAAHEGFHAVEDNLNTSASFKQQQHKHRHQRARVSDNQVPTLARDEVLDTVFSFVGVEDYYYVAGVCRNWRGRYIAFCDQATSKKYLSDTSVNFNTSRKNIVMTAARLQLALDNGLTIYRLSKPWRLSTALTSSSLEPVEVLTVARCYGLQWKELLPIAAATVGKLELLQWLHKCGCPMDLNSVIEEAVENNHIEVVTWLYKQFASSFTTELKQAMLWRAGWLDKLPMVKWLREHDAEWPDAFCYHEDSSNAMTGADTCGCWSLQCVQYAIANGCTWRGWHCQDYDEMHQECSCDSSAHDDGSSDSELCDVMHAKLVFKWAHENGCPCTCEAAAAAV
jgi:hypothetical protein